MRKPAKSYTHACYKCQKTETMAARKGDVAPDLTFVETLERKGWKVFTGGGPLSSFIVRAYCPTCKS